MNGDDSTRQCAVGEGCSCGFHSHHRRMPRLLLLGLGASLVVSVWYFRAPLRQRIFAAGVLANDAPTADAVDTLIREAADPSAALLALWNTGQIVHRELAIHDLGRVGRGSGPLPAELRKMLLAAALDPDMDVREAALSDLENRHDPALTPLAAAQLRDVDPLVRLLGVNHLEHAPAKVGVPLLMPLLDDENPQIVAAVLKLLERWSGEKFGVKMADAVSVEDEKTGLTVFHPESYAKTRAGAERAKAWWAKHQADFPPVPLAVPAEALAGLRPIVAKDFILPALDGGRVRLSGCRGKVVLINCWTTWCTACVGEMPELIALQKQHRDDLVILGVSLDFVPDEDGEHQSAPAEIRRKIARTVKSRGINYPVLLDEQGTVGGRFNGGELPTTVIIDAAGRVRRRFIGARPLPVFEAMIAEASQAQPVRHP